MLEEMVNFMNTQSHSFLGREGEFVFAKRCERAPNIPTTIESRDTDSGEKRVRYARPPGIIAQWGCST
jgi:hypothetical protein